MRKNAEPAPVKPVKRVARRVAGERQATQRLGPELLEHLGRLKRASKGLGISSATIAAISRGGQIAGFQLRLGTKVSRGLTAHFGVKKYGGETSARRAAAAVAGALDLRIARGRGGSAVGRRNVRSSSPEAGIRLFWVERSSKQPGLFVGVSWPERDGRQRMTCYSTDSNGLQGAIDRAVERRIAAGCPTPDRTALLRAARRMRREGPQA